MRRWLIPFLFIFVLAALAFTAGDDLQILLEKLDKFRKAYPQEKVHLHFDKPYYSIGDTLYFKAYVVNAEKNLPSAISNVLYVDLMDENGAVRQTLRRPITDGVCWGTVDLVDSLMEGTYRIRAYTNWMRNFSEAYFFNQVVAIGNGLTNDIVAVPAFKFDFSPDKKMDSVSITYQALRGNHVAGREATYSITVAGKEVEKGKGTVDNDGRLYIAFPKMRPHTPQPAELIVRIKLDAKKTATKVLKFVLPAAKYSIQFFPEGGQLINGLGTRIGFKAIDANGAGVDVSGDVKDKNAGGVPFKSGMAGIGSFPLTPQAGHDYEAVVRYKDGTEETVPLPRAEAYGYVLTIDNTDEETVKINIAARQATPVTYVTLIGQSNNRTHYAATVNLVGDSALVVVSKKKFPTGIVQFTVFDATTQPVAERLIFINHQDQLRIHTQLNKPTYGTREPVRMTLTVTDANGDPVSGNFSIAVTDGKVAARDETKECGLLSNILLTSDLRGYIENPEYYFSDINKVKQRALDDLLLTQGWRRFVWNEIRAEKYPATPFAVEKNLVLRGTVLSMKGEPVPRARVTLLSRKSPGYMLDTVADERGRFTFADLDFSDDKPVVIQAAKQDGSRAIQVKLDEFSTPPVGGRINESGAWPMAAPSIQPYLLYSAHRFDEMKKHGLLKDSAQLLKEIVITAKTQTKLQEAVAPSYNLNGPGNADQVITYQDLQNCSDLAQCLAGRLVGITFKLVPDKSVDSRTPVPRLQAFSTRGNGAPMLVILDGMDISPYQGLDIRNIPATNVQSIEVLRHGALLATYGPRGAAGVLVITTKRGGIDYNAGLTVKPPNNTLFTTAKGYAVYRKFYAPDHSQPSPQGTMADLRSTIFWQPNVITDDNGKATLTFYNADNAGRYNVIIEGFSATGQLGRATFSYEVK